MARLLGLGGARRAVARHARRPRDVRRRLRASRGPVRAAGARGHRPVAHRDPRGERIGGPPSRRLLDDAPEGQPHRLRGHRGHGRERGRGGGRPVPGHGGRARALLRGVAGGVARPPAGRGPHRGLPAGRGAGRARGASCSPSAWPPTSPWSSGRTLAEAYMFRLAPELGREARARPRLRARPPHRRPAASSSSRPWRRSLPGSTRARPITPAEWTGQAVDEAVRAVADWRSGSPRSGAAHGGSR